MVVSVVSNPPEGAAGETWSLVEAAADLGDRFRRAQRAALVAAGAPPAPAGAWAPPVAADMALAEKRVFENGLRLGRGFARFFGKEITLGELGDLLPGLGSPCLAGSYRVERDALVLERPGCPVGALGAAACDFHREACLGLCLGVTGDVELSRHGSVGHGSPACIDVFHADPDPESPLRFGPMAPEVASALAAVRRSVQAFDSGAEVRFLGVSEGVLFYRLGESKRPGGLHLQSLVERGLRRRLPGLEPREVSPRPVPVFETEPNSAPPGGP